MNTSKRRLLVSTDFSPCSAHALRFAIDLAKSLDASLTILHCYEVPSFSLPDGSIVLATPIEHARLVDDVSTHLAHAARIARDGQVEAKTRSELGRPVESILRVLREPGWYAMVMGTHGRHGIGRLVLGSVAEQVLRASKVPVITVRDDADADG